MDILCEPICRPLYGSTALFAEDAHGTCPFYLKIGACRHGDQCSRHHVRPTSSQTLLLSHLYPVPAAAVRIAAGELWEEPTYDAVQKHLEDFYDEVFHELATYGEIEDMIIADNVSEHMLGNIYVKYFMEEDAEKALQKLTGRYYAGRVIKAEFSPVTDFREARCRAFHEARCNRGGYCNFLHIKHIPRGNKRRLILEMYEDYPHYAHKKERIQKWSKTKELELKKQQEQQQNASQNGLMHPAMAAWGAAGGLLPMGGPPVGALGGPGHAAFAAAYGAAPWNGAGMAAGGYWGAGPGGAGAGGPPGAAGFPIDFAAMGGPYGAGLMGGYGGGGHKGGHYDSYYGGGKKGKGGKNYNWTGGMAALPPMSGPPGSLHYGPGDQLAQDPALLHQQQQAALPAPTSENGNHQAVDAPAGGESAGSPSNQDERQNGKSNPADKAGD